MAVVRFSQELRESIEGAAVRPFDVRYTAEVQSLPKTYGPKMYEKAAAPYIQYMNKLPDEFFVSGTNIRLEKVKAGEDWIQLVWRVDFPIQSSLFPHTGKFPGRLYDPFSYGGGSYIANMDDPEDAEFVGIVKDWLERVAAIRRERQEFLDSVKQIINNFTTLSPALKVWPPLWDLLPEATRERHRLVVDKQKRDPAEDLTVDLNKMTGVVTRHKLMR